MSNAPKLPATKQWITFRHQNGKQSSIKIPVRPDETETCIRENAESEFWRQVGNRRVPFYRIDKDSVRAAMTATDCPGIERNCKSWKDKDQERYQAFCAELDALEAAANTNTAP